MKKRQNEKKKERQKEKKKERQKKKRRRDKKKKEGEKKIYNYKKNKMGDIFILGQNQCHST